MSAAAPPDTRSRELSQLGPRGWWFDHLTESGVMGPEARCACKPGIPDITCDLGEALWRVRLCELGRRKDGLPVSWPPKQQ